MKLNLSSVRNRAPYPIVPVFLPFSGCPHRCVFCAQDKQTGGRSDDVGKTLERAEAELALRREQGKVCEIAFFGGTFTLIPHTLRERCMRLAAQYREFGTVRAVRCSTRPDAVTADNLYGLRNAGTDTVELGVQSFCNTALAASQRGYGGECAEKACRLVRNVGLNLGIQLLPGMPGCTPDIFLADVHRALSLRPSFMRFYPCLVVKGTALEGYLKSGMYKPWSIEETVDILSRALRAAWAAHIPVIRLSVAPEPVFDRDVIDGPRHEALGNMIQGRALFDEISKWLDGAALRSSGRLRLPRYVQGMFAGHKKELLPHWQAIGITPHSIDWCGGDDAEWHGH